jgi:hypothetical protein
MNTKADTPPGNSQKTRRAGRNAMYVYIETEPGLWTVGFYTPDGKWIPESDHSEREDAAKRVAYLNGGTGA